LSHFIKQETGNTPSHGLATNDQWPNSNFRLLLDLMSKDLLKLGHPIRGRLTPTASLTGHVIELKTHHPPTPSGQA
jgi:hypothetical protein